MKIPFRRILALLLGLALVFAFVMQFIIGYKVQLRLNYRTGETESRIMRGDVQSYVIQRVNAVPYARERYSQVDDWHVAYERHLDLFEPLRIGCNRHSVAYVATMRLGWLTDRRMEFELAQNFSDEFLRILNHEGGASADYFVVAHLYTDCASSREMGEGQRILEMWMKSVNTDHPVRERTPLPEHVSVAQTPPDPGPQGLATGDVLVAGSNGSIADLGMDLVWVAPGRSYTRADDGDHDGRPISTVEIAQGYWVGKTEVTQAQYEALTGDNPSFFKGENLPVEQVSWHEAMRYCELLTERERRGGRLPEGYIYRLPTKTEREYAARGGSQGMNTRYSGSDTLDEVAWYWNNSGRRTHPVGAKAPNELGLHDMSGNVWEWGCEESWRRVLHGGCWRYPASDCRVAFRTERPAEVTYANIGFRVVLGARENIIRNPPVTIITLY